MGDVLDAEAIVEGKKLLLGIFGGLMSCTHQYIAQFSFSTYFRNDYWYWVVYEVLSSGLTSIPLSPILNNRNLRKQWSICVQMTSIPVVGVNSPEYVDSFCCANFTMKNKSCIH